MKNIFFGTFLAILAAGAVLWLIKSARDGAAQVTDLRRANDEAEKAVVASDRYLASLATPAPAAPKPSAPIPAVSVPAAEPAPKNAAPAQASQTPRTRYHAAARDRVASFLPAGPPPSHSTLAEADDQWTFARQLPNSTVWETGGVVQYYDGTTPARAVWTAYVLEHSAEPPEVVWQKVGSTARGDLAMARSLAGIASAGTTGR